ncbi:MAG: hypothetical protein JOY56_14110 [Solirubrobacterales bacterium]|nr:hypothetical protein [Solirubrobacterales bacterium]
MLSLGGPEEALAEIVTVATDVTSAVGPPGEPFPAGRRPLRGDKRSP